MDEDNLQCIVCHKNLTPFESFGDPYFKSDMGPICWAHLNEWYKENR